MRNVSFSTTEKKKISGKKGSEVSITSTVLGKKSTLLPFNSS